jgi:hypothetical protein
MFFRQFTGVVFSIGAAVGSPVGGWNGQAVSVTRASAAPAILHPIANLFFRGFIAYARSLLP